MKTPLSVSSNTQKLNFSLDLRIVVVALLVIILAMLLIWRPWSGNTGADARTVSVTGEATIRAEPDEYQFYPSYQFENTDKDAAIKAASARQTEIVNELKKLGVADKQIKTNLNGYEDYSAKPEPAMTVPAPDRPGSSNGYTYTLSITVTVPTKTEAQKVQDYLATTSPIGSVTPSPTFSESKRKELESHARGKATEDARRKADQSAENLGFKVGAVKSVEEGSGFGGVIPFRGATTMEGDKAVASDLSLQPGENELNYSVTVVYFIR